MKRYVRRIMFWSLVLLFFVTTPVAILYTQGYRFDNNKLIFIHSGSITVKSTPANPNIFVNGKAKSSGTLDIINNSVTVGGLRPGNYDLRVAANGYFDWEKNVGVHSGLSAEFWNIALIPQKPTLQQIDSSNVQRFFPSPFGKYVAFVSNSDKGISLSVSNIKNNLSQIIFSADDGRFPDDLKKNIEWNSKEDMLLVPVERTNGRDFIIASAQQDFDPLYVSDLSKTKNPFDARWSPKEKGVFYFLAPDPKNGGFNLYRENINDKSEITILQNITSYNLSNNGICFLQNNNILYKSDLDGNNPDQISSSSLTTETLGEKARLIVYDDSRQALLTDNGDLFIHNDATDDTIKKLDGGVQGMQFSDDGKKLLFWSDNEISVLFLRKWEVQPYREENEIQSIMRLATPIKNVFWYKDYEHVFFSTQNKVKIIELDNRDHRISNDILENNTDDFGATYDSGKGIYYFVRDGENGKSIFYFELPVKTGFFG